MTRPHSTKRWVSALCAIVCSALSACLLASCAVATDPVERVYTNLVDKQVFAGEWWHSTTVIDGDYDSSTLFAANGQYPPFTGSMSSDLGVDFNRGGPSALGSRVYSFPIARIRWVIDERYLFAFRSHELVQGGNDGATDPGYTGQPLAVYAIVAHVDVRREYNQITGEQTNVVSENTRDRRWYERQFIRVDWSRNLITDFAPNENGFAALYGDFTRATSAFVEDAEAIAGLPASYAPQVVRVSEDPDYRFASEWPASERDAVHYMSFVNREIWTPGASCGACSSVNVTLRNAFLRVPPRHEYAAETLTHREFDRFGVFRSHQSTYARGGRDIESLAIHCRSDSDCGAGGVCDVDRFLCIGGLTDDQGETDFLAFYRARHNFYADSLTDTACAADWQCDRRYDEPEVCNEDCQQALRDASGSVCDPAAKRCTIPLRFRPKRPVTYTLSAHFPKHLVRAAFAAVGHWNEPLMAGQRAAQGLLPIEQEDCREPGSPDPVICTTDVRAAVRTECQTADPTAYCFCGSPEADSGDCPYKYDPFETPDAARARGVPNPYDCFIAGPADAVRPSAYEDYTSDVYGYRFVGNECLLLLRANSCDADPTRACEELGDLRHQFVAHVAQGGVGFSGVAMPLVDPTSGELIVANANVAAQSLEFIATQAAQFYPVLRGETPEDQYFSGEHVRGYFARLDKVEHPVSIAPSYGDGFDPLDTTRPASTSDVLADLQDRIEAVAPKIDQLRGADGRARLFSDRVSTLVGTSIESQLLGAIDDPRTATSDINRSPGVTQDQSPLRPTAVSGASRGVAQELDLAQRNVCRFDEALFNARYSRYWAEAFADRPLAEASVRMQQTFFQGIMLHELGHSLGLRHNFAGSLDRNHYHDGYYEIGRRLPLPSYLDYDDPDLGGDDDGLVTGEEALRWSQDLRSVREQRLELGLGNTMSASIMDYDGDTSMYSGLGRYDRGAAIFNYFDGVEAFITADPRVAVNPLPNSSSSLIGLMHSDQHRRVLWTYYRGGDRCAVDNDCPQGPQADASGLRAIFQRCVTNSRDDARPRPCNGPGRCMCSNFDDDFRDYVDGRAYRTTNTPREFYPVQYLYCHDNRVGDLSWCTPLDAGESFQEVVEHYRSRWHDRYPQTYFRNFRRGGPSEAGSYSDIVDAAKIFQHLWFRRTYEPEFRVNFGPLGYNDQLLASIDTMNWYAEIIGLPDVGAYKLDTDDNVYRKVSDDPTSAAGDFGLAPGQGFHLWSAYQDTHQGFRRLERAGTFLDKFYAIDALARRNWGLSFTLDERYFVNFFDAFETEVTELFAGLVLRNARWYAPRVSVDSQGDPTVRYLSVYRALDRGSQDATYPEPAIDGSDTEVLRSWAAIQALANFPVYYDTSFDQRMRVFKLGTGDGYEIPATRADGTPTCGYGDANCDAPDYVVYESDRVHVSYVAVQIYPTVSSNQPEQQIAYQLLRGLHDRQDEVRELRALPAPNAAQQARLRSLLLTIERDESFVEYLIELGRRFGLTSDLFR